MSAETPNRQPELEKTDQQIADQIVRIANKLAERTEFHTVAVEEKSTPDNGELIQSVSVNLGGSVSLRKTHVKGVNEVFEDGSRNKMINIAAFPSPAYSGDEPLRPEYIKFDKDGNAKSEKLTRKQTVSASAKILAKARGEVASREKEIKELTDL